jgi:uncharacterized protein YjbI with pentapeptide repeats
MEGNRMKRGDPKKIVGIILGIFAFLSIKFGYCYVYGNNLTLHNLVNDLYANIGTELASIALIVLIIDYLSDRRADKNLRDQLAREMGLKDNAFATKAVKELRAHGWLTDGSLHGIDLGASDLSGADLTDADLSNSIITAANLNRSFLVNAKLTNAIINGANLEDADLSNANLMNADLRWSDLSHVDFRGAQLDGADFEGAALDDAKITLEQLRSVKSLAQATMPDGRKYDAWVGTNSI